MNSANFPNFKLLISYIKTKKKSLLLLIFGFSLITVILFSSTFFLSSFKPYFSLTYMTNLKSDENDITFSFNYRLDDYLETNNQSIKENIVANNITRSFNSSIGSFLSSDVMKTIYSYSGLTCFSIYDSINHTLSLINANAAGLGMLYNLTTEQNLSIPQDQGGILVVEDSILTYNPNDASILNYSEIEVFDNYTERNQHNLTIKFSSKLIWSRNNIELYDLL